MMAHRYFLYPLALAGALGLAACGGGSSGGSSTAAAPTGTVNVAVTDGPSDEFQHVWVTVTAISFHTSPTQVWDKADATWITKALPAPTTVDLSALNNGTLNNQIFANLGLPAGTYRQIRFFFDGADAGLDASAFGTSDSNGAALQWNDQVEYLDPNNAWAITEAPLQIAYPTQGIQLLGTFNVSDGGTLDLAVDFDLEHIIVPFQHGAGAGSTYFTMRPNLFYFDMSQVGAITGKINPGQLCQSAQAEISQTPTCAYNLVVKAELLAADGSRHYVARQTTVDPLSGRFTLYPLATKDANGNPIAGYDVLIRGREMETMLVTGVAVTQATAPNGTGAMTPTSLQSTAIVLTLNPNEYTAQFATPLRPLSSGYAIFQQTLPPSPAVPAPVPYEVRWRNTDPFTGIFRNPIPLQGATSSLHFAPYNGGNTLSFAAAAPQEGAGAFTVADNEVLYYALSAAAVMQPPGAPSTSQTFTPGAPSLVNGVQSGTINVSLSFSGIVNDNNCELVISRFAAIVDTYDCGPWLSTNGGMNSGTQALTGVPGGSLLAPVPGAYYYAYVVLWRTGGKLTRTITPLPGFIDLRTTNAQPLNGSVPGA